MRAVEEKIALNIQAEWISHIVWVPFSVGLLDFEISLGKDIYDSLHMSRRFEYPWVNSNLQPFSPNDIVLDAGPGNTALQFLIAKQVEELHSLDIHEPYVEWVAKICEEKHYDNVFPECGDILHAPYADNYFDKVICISVLEHLPKDQIESAIDELIRVVKPGGKIALTMDISLTPTDHQMDLNDFRGLVSQWFTIPEFNEGTMVFTVEPQDIAFSVICMLIRKES